MQQQQQHNHMKSLVKSNTNVIDKIRKHTSTIKKIIPFISLIFSKDLGKFSDLKIKNKVIFKLIFKNELKFV